MPASQRARGSRATSTSRPYDRRSPTASPARVAQYSIPQSAPPALDTLPDANTGVDPSTITLPDRPGLPTYADYKRIEMGYLYSLSPRKRDKALITQAMFDKIWDVLHEPEACTIDTPQFRFWVRKMFTLSRPVWVEGAEGETGGDGGGRGGWTWGGEMDTLRCPDSDSDADIDADDLALERAMGIGAGQGANTSSESVDTYLVSAVVLHENRPVAVMEQLYELLCYCHVRAGHGGRDKTCAVIRQHYSWVPKELTAQFVKACPTCAMKRSGAGVCGGVDMGVVQKRAGQRERRRRRTPEEEMPRAVPDLVWPTTAGPLDPANPGPCGLEGSLTHVLVDNATHSPTKMAGLPSLASALSLEEAMHLHLHPTRLQGEDDAGDLPPVLQPLRLSGPCIPDAPPSPSGASSSSSSGKASLSLLLHHHNSPAHARAHPRLFPIDPVLLSFDCPGLVGLDSPDAMMPRLVEDATPEAQGPVDAATGDGRNDSPGPARARPAPAHRGGTSAEDVASERAAAFALSLSTGSYAVAPSTTMTTRQCGSSSSPSCPSLYGCYRGDSPGTFAVLYPPPSPLHHLYCATDEGLGGLGQEHDGTLSPLAIMTDA